MGVGLPEFAVFLAESRVLSPKLLTRRTGELGVFDRSLDFVGVVVDALSGAAGFLGLFRNVAVLTAQTGCSVANPGKDR